MKVLFAVNSESVSDAIIKKYQKDYREILSYKNVYYFNAIQKEIQQDKTYNRIVISVDLEPFSSNNYESIDKFIFEKLDLISDEAHDSQGNEISIILICSDRHSKGSSFLVKLFGIGVYNALLGSDRSMEEVCRLINKPRTKKEAKIYYKIDSDEVNYKVENDDEVDEVQIQNILAHFKRLGKNTEKYAESFENIALQYNNEQLKIIINCLPNNVKKVLELKSPKYQEIMEANGIIVQGVKNTSIENMEDQKRTGLKIDIIENKRNQSKINGPIVIPHSVGKVSSQNAKKVIAISQKEQNVNEPEKTKVRKVIKPERRVENLNDKQKVDEINNVEVKKQPVIVEKENEVTKKRRGRPRKVAVTEEQPKISKVKRKVPQKELIDDELPDLETITEEQLNLDSFDDNFDSQINNNKAKLPLEDFENSEIDKNAVNSVSEEAFDEFDDYDEYGKYETKVNKSIHDLDDETESDELDELDDLDDETESDELDQLDGLDDLDSEIVDDSDDDTDTLLSDLDDEDDLLSDINDEESEENLFSDDDTDNTNLYDDFDGNDTNDDELNNGYAIESDNDINTKTNSLESIESPIDYSMSTLNSLMTKDKKIVTFLGSTKNGVSFLVNNLAEIFASVGINTAILDMTKNRNSYYIYTQNEENLRQIAYNSIDKLQRGIADGIRIKKNLTVYTALPNDGKNYPNVEDILSTLVQNHSLILIDCDFETNPAYFASCQEIYLVQSMDILTIQPLTAFLRDLKTQGVFEPEKVRVVINKELKVRGLTAKAIIGGMSSYNDPAMSFMTELFDKDLVKYCSIPFEEMVYSRYLEGMLNCKISISGYSKNFMNKLRVLGDMVYPLTSKQTYFSNVNQNYETNNFSSSMNDTLKKMKRKF